MKKKIFISFAALAVAAVAAWNVYLANAQSNELSDLMLANVEALAEKEHGGYNKNPIDIWKYGLTKDEISIAKSCFEDQTDKGGGPHVYVKTANECQDGGTTNCDSEGC
jgi:hypothetical protein